MIVPSHTHTHTQCYWGCEWLLSEWQSSVFLLQPFQTGSTPVPGAQSPSSSVSIQQALAGDRGALVLAAESRRTGYESGFDRNQVHPSFIVVWYFSGWILWSISLPSSLFTIKAEGEQTGLFCNILTSACMIISSVFIPQGLLWALLNLNVLKSVFD